MVLESSALSANRAAKKGGPVKYLIAHIFEQIGRYGRIAFMILPIFTEGWKFGFQYVAEMFPLSCFL